MIKKGLLQGLFYDSSISLGYNLRYQDFPGEFYGKRK